MSILCTSPANIAIENHRIKLNAIYGDKAEKKRRKDWCTGKKCACGCGRDANTPHHPTLDLYKEREVYLNLDECEPWYHRCHHSYHKGRVKCPRCGQSWVKEGSVRCGKCITNEEKEQIRIRKERRIKLQNKLHDRGVRHPCGNREKYQGCKNGGTCNYSWKRARACGGFAEATA